MRLDTLTVGRFKNLRDLRVDFDEESPYTVLVGENGSGKSNLIEALTLIFRALDLDEPAPFAYELSYRCRGSEIRIHAEDGRTPRFWAKEISVDGEPAELSKKKFMQEDEEGRPRYRPAFVFGYYSGPSDRLSSLYDKHRERYYRLIIQPHRKRSKQAARSNVLRRLFYAQNLHGQFALLAFFMEPEGSTTDWRVFLKEHLQIEGLDSVLFSLRRPPWRRNSGGDGRFWHAEGEVREFLDRLYDAALLPVRMNRRIRIDLTRDPLVESLYLFLPGPDALETVYRSYDSQYAFFTALESTYISKVLGEVRTRVRMSPGAGATEVTYRDLSEGEQQLLLVLGLLKFTAEDEALFLLDEPDTHLNPVWATQYLDFLEQFIRLRERRDTCHIIMSSHDPLVFSRLRRTEVQVLKRDQEGRVFADPPVQDPRGMGIEAILSSDLFGLRSGGLDLPTQRDLDTQRGLAAKEGALSPDERLALKQLTERLNGLGFWKSSHDTLFGLFLQAWAERARPEWRETVGLGPDELAEREGLARMIVNEIREKEGDDK